MYLIYVSSFRCVINKITKSVEWRRREVDGKQIICSCKEHKGVTKKFNWKLTEYSILYLSKKWWNIKIILPLLIWRIVYRKSYTKRIGVVVKSYNKWIGVVVKSYNKWIGVVIKSYNKWIGVVVKGLIFQEKCVCQMSRKKIRYFGISFTQVAHEGAFFVKKGRALNKKNE